MTSQASRNLKLEQNSRGVLKGRSQLQQQLEQRGGYIPVC